jgi:D-arabinose 1-dehydrogenase-like Zn-dependent alcohol dehydrogenase
LKALQLVRPRQFQTVEIARPEIGDDQILVRLEKAALCSSDIPKFTLFWKNLHLIASVTPPDETFMFRAADLIGRLNNSWLF